MMRRRTYWQRTYDRDVVRSRHHPPGPFPLVLVLDHLKAGFNVPKILRSANAFGCREVHLVGIGPFDPSPGMGALRHTRTVHHERVEASLAALSADGYAVFALDLCARLALGEVALPERTAFVLGHEEWGLTFDPAAHGIIPLRVRQFGVVQSLNVSVAASLAAYEWTRQHARLAAETAPAPRSPRVSGKGRAPPPHS